MRRIFSTLLCLCFLAAPLPTQQDAKYVALTFDDGPSGHYSRNLLDGLQERGAKATFLLCGYRIQEFPQITRRIQEEGHEIGLHGYSHRNMQTLSRREIAKELMDTEALLPPGCRVRFLRPPGGCCNDAVRQVAQARNLAILQWSVDPRDWASASSRDIEKNVLKSVTDGDVILLHDMSDSSVSAALRIVDELSSQGYQFVTVSELVALRGAVLKAGKCYNSFPKA